MARKCLIGALALAPLVTPAIPQGTRKKPVLVRREAVPDKPAEAEIVEPDPVQARKHMEVGDFYFKRDNFKAAAERYREAVKYAPRNPDPYERLIRALEKMDDFAAAKEVCDDFVLANPDSKKAADFQEKAVKLEAKAKGE